MKRLGRGMEKQSANTRVRTWRVSLMGRKRRYKRRGSLLPKAGPYGHREKQERTRKR